MVDRKTRVRTKRELRRARGIGDFQIYQEARRNYKNTIKKSKRVHGKQFLTQQKKITNIEFESLDPRHGGVEVDAEDFDGHLRRQRRRTKQLGIMESKQRH